jgi:hypothetical protein
MSTVRLEVAPHGNAHWVEWVERDGDRERRGVVMGSRRVAPRDTTKVLDDMRERLVTAGFEVRVDDDDAPAFEVVANTQQVENATGRLLRT